MNKTTLNSQKAKHSMLSLRRATPAITPCTAGAGFLSTLSLRRATLQMLPGPQISTISIHALLAESDPTTVQNIELGYISIHALLAESDLAEVFKLWRESHFYPRSPCGERPPLADGAQPDATFLSTLSLRRATPGLRAAHSATRISIHALLAESDSNAVTPLHPLNVFLSTLSLRRATAKVHKTVGHFCAYETNFMGIASSC